MKSFLYAIWEIVEVILIAVIAVFLIRNFLIQPFLVNGASMEPNFSSGDYLLIDEISYRFREPQRGEVVVFHYPGDGKTYFIKRIVGLPGERVLINGGKITVFSQNSPDGFAVEENYLPYGVQTPGEIDVVLENNEYFVLGDNRQYSFDSRNWGSLVKAEIVGLARLRLWPLNKVMAFDNPAY